MIKKQTNGRWLVDLWVNGRGSRRVRKLFDTKLEARRFESLVLSRRAQGQEWNPSARDNRKLSQLVDLWFDCKGSHLKDGTRRKRSLISIAQFFGDPTAASVTPADFLRYRSYKFSEGKTGKTLNNHLGYINAVYNELHRISETDYPNPLASVSPVPLDEVELSWLTLDEVRQLLQTIESFSSNPHVCLLTRLCLATGARWGEAERVTLRHLRNNKVTFNRTKSGKSRSVPLSPELFDALTNHLEQWGQFSSSLSAFRRAFDQSGIQVSRGQCSHVLRHTFASHFVMNGGHILTLQKILGHSTIVMTMRYAHLAPDHLADAVRFAPV